MEQLSFNTIIGYDDIQKQFEYLLEKQRKNVRILCNGSYGILPDTDTYSYSSVLRPSLYSNRLEFTSGRIVTKKGDFVEIPSFSVDIPSINQDVLVIYTYTLKGSYEKRLSNNGKAYSVFYVEESPDKCIKFVTLSKYNQLTSDVLDNSVCLAVLNDTVGEVSVDLSSYKYSFNRPLFSLSDVSHRSKLGSGDSSVPHNIGLNDLTSGDLTIYEQLLTRGILISKDYGIAGIPGTFYKNEGDFKISTIDFNNDGNPIKIIDLKDCYPNAIASVTDEEGNDIACHLVDGTNYIIIDDDSRVGTKVNIQMCVTNTLIPKFNSSSVNELNFKPQDSNDTIITQGLQIRLSSTSVSFSDCSDFDKNFEIVVNKDGTIHKEPEVICSKQKLSKYSNKSISQSFDVPCKIQLCRFGNSKGKVNIVISGLDSENNSLEESISMDLDDINSSYITTNYFKKITSIYSKDSLDYSSVNLVIFAYANRALDKRLRIASLSWNGKKQTFDKIKDIRPISTVIRDPLKISVVKEAACNLLTTLNAKEEQLVYKTILIEDFSYPKYLDANSVTWITANKGMNFPIIPEYIADTSSYTLCYRSRKLRITGSSKKCIVYAYLVQAGLETINSNPVRLIIDSRELILDRVSEGLYKIELEGSDMFGKILVSGDAAGISVFYKEIE